MNEPLNTRSVSEPAKGRTEGTLAIIAIVCGVISLCGIVVPVVGVPMSLLALVLGFYGRKDPERKILATIGMSLGGIGLLLSCLPISIAMMRLLGPKVGNTYSPINTSLP